ncbi:Aste57867_5382 [Aphanomyces stellatus]|uniref:Aste57867_5382 protein n=1 Tax=Aphanomyces stellatus TaxID=120398 RepID=A0A485KDC4_9STRA|nr:hypothetical protein As57867_005369 [Aphanomyces stellatus]VFT82440.1 Aste57867_5382 [Aphanomyces stellatus]
MTKDPEPAQPFVAVDTPRELTLSSSGSASKQEPQLASLTELFQFADSTDVTLMVVGSIAAIGTGLSQPLQIVLFGNLLNAFGPIQDTTTAVAAMSFFATQVNDVVYKFMALATAVLVTGFVQIACWSITASRQSKRLRQAYAAAILRQEVGWFDLHEPAQLASRVADSTLLVQEGLGRKVGDGINFAAMAIGSLVLAFYYGWQLTLVLLAFTPLMGASAFYMSKIVADAVQGGVTAYAEAGGIAEESLSNVKTVHMFNAGQAMVEKYVAALVRTEASGVKKGLAVGVGTGVLFALMLWTNALGMYYGAVKITNDQLGPEPCTGANCYDGGRVITVFFCVVIGSMAIGQAGPGLQAITTARSAARDIFDLLARPSAIDASSTDGDMLDSVQGEIALEDVHFAYPSRPDVQVCGGYSLVIPAGQRIALVGPSGSGKSTIVSLVERFYDPAAGRVLLDGHDLKTLNVQWLRSQFGLVGQEPCLFADSIAANIRHGNPTATLDQVHDAAKQANAYDFIMGFPDGFDTQVGDRGAQLSGGQKQRIAIARAILKNPAVLLLDEATSALDTESEHIVQTSLDQLVAARRRTTIIIAHRLSTIRNADRIVVLSQGRVVEDGTHESLMQMDGGQYKALVQAQHRTKAQGKDDEADYQLGVAAQYVSETPATVEQTKRLNDEQSHVCSDDESVTSAVPVPISRVWRLSSPEWPQLVCGGLAALVHGSLHPMWGVILTKCTLVFYQVNLGSDGMRHEALKWTFAFVGVGVAILLALTVQNHQFAIVSERLTTRIRSLCFSAMLRQDMAWFDHPSHASGALTTRLATDSAAIRAMTAGVLNAVLINVATLGVALSIALYYSWRLSLVFLAAMPLMAAAQVLQMEMEQSQTGKSVNDGDVQAGALLSQAIHAIRTVASFNLEAATISSYFAHLGASAATDRRVGFRGGLAYAVAQSSVLFALAGVFYYGGWLVQRGQLNFESMFMVINSLLFCTFGIGLSTQALGDVGKAKKSIARVFAIIDRDPPIDCASSEGITLESVSGAIELKHVVFSYPSRPESAVYTDYSLKIEPGQTVALVGGSGSGKSTAINLIERFYDPAAGAVFLDGHDLKTLNVQSVREHISIVGQEPVLFRGTIRDNIATGKPDATLDDVVDAAKKANAHDFIMQFPDGYDTAVGDRGVQVSGGQKQRIAIARAIIRDPAVLLLDEATSALDNESERIVQASLDQLLQMKRRTTIIVAHRLSTIRHADVIAVVDSGRVMEQGTHDQLMAIPQGIYAQLVARQMQ